MSELLFKIILISMFGITGIIVGIILIIIGLFIAIYLPGISGGLEMHQPQQFSVSFIIIGLFLIIIGGVLVFV